PLRRRPERSRPPSLRRGLAPQPRATTTGDLAGPTRRRRDESKPREAGCGSGSSKRAAELRTSDADLGGRSRSTGAPTRTTAILVVHAPLFIVSIVVPRWRARDPVSDLHVSIPHECGGVRPHPEPTFFATRPLRMRVASLRAVTIPVVSRTGRARGGHHAGGDAERCATRTVTRSR